MKKIYLSIVAMTAMLWAAQSALAQMPADDPRNPDPWPAIAATPVTEALRGIWAKPDCAMADKMFVMSEYYILKGWPEIYYLGPVRNVRGEDFDGDTLYHLQSLNYSLVLNLSNDGLLKTREVPVHPKQALYMTWGSQQRLMADEYTRCAKLFETSLSFGQEEVNTPFILDLVHKGCTATTRESFASDQTCQAAIFAAVDSSKDGFLNRDELARLYRQGIFLLSATAQICQQQTVYSAETNVDADEFAALVFDRLAPSDDRGVSQAAMTAALSAPGFIDGRIYELVESLRNLNNILAFLPAPDSARTCNAGANMDPRTLGTMMPEIAPEIIPEP